MAWYLYKAAQGVLDQGAPEPVSMDMVSNGMDTSSASLNQGFKSGNFYFTSKDKLDLLWCSGRI